MDNPEKISLNDSQERINRDLPYGVQVAAAWSWRLIIIIVGVALGIWLFSHLTLLVIPILVAALVSTLLYPLHAWLVIRNVPPVLSALGLILAFFTVIGFLLTIAGRELAVGFSDMYGQVVLGIRSVIRWAEAQGLSFSTIEWNDVLHDVWGTVRNNSDMLVSGAIGFGSTATNLVAGTLMMVFVLIFFLLDGPRIWTAVLSFVPQRHRRAIGGAGFAGWRSLGSYVRVQIFVAFIDAVGIGLGAYFLGVPLVLPLSVLVFLASFIPFVGAIATGAIAVLLALVANGLTNAVLMFLVVLAVQQLESNVLQPLIMGKAVSLHPLVVFLAVTGGTALIGLVGAIFAVPLLAFLNSSIRYLVAKPWVHEPDFYARIPGGAKD